MMNSSASLSDEDYLRSIEFAANKLKIQDFKDLQAEALLHHLKGKDVFVNLPTGFGKSLIFQAAPICKDFLEGRDASNKSVAFVLCPVTALIEDQIKHLQQIGLDAVYLGGPRDIRSWESNVESIKMGKFSVVFTSPESICSQHGKDLLASREVRRSICGIFIDECHCVAKWGHSDTKTKAFREEYGKLAVLRAFVPGNVSFVALTATATAAVKKTVAESLAMLSYVSVSASPDRPNIKLVVVDLPKKKPYESPLAMDWLICRLKTLGSSMPRIIMYCRSHVQCHSLYGLFEEQIEDTKLFAMYHGSTHPDVQKKVVDDFEDPDGKIRILFATIAFGMGVDAKGVHTIMHLGVPCDIDDYVQESGRCGRNGKQSVSIIVKYPAMYSGTRTSERMKAFAANSTECRRKLVLSEFHPVSDSDISLPGHLCCDICAKDCTPSESCEEEANIVALFNFRLSEVAFERRIVSTEEREVLEEKLFAYRRSLLDSATNTKFLAGQDLATGIPAAYLKEIVLECDIVFPNFEVFHKQYPFYDIEQANIIWEITKEVLGSCAVFDIALDPGDYYGQNESESEHAEGEDDGDVDANSYESNSSHSFDSDFLSDNDC